MKFVLAYPEDPRLADGIRDYSLRMVEELRAEGNDASLARTRRGRRLAGGLIRVVSPDEEASIIVQYNPFAWGRWGIAPCLLVAALLVRVRRPRSHLLVTIHEGYVPVTGPRSLLMGTWQRFQLRVLLALADGVVATTGRLAAELSRTWPHRRIDHVPVGSNLPDERQSRAKARQAAGVEGKLVIASLSAGHESHLHSYVARATEAVAEASPRPVVLLLLGSKNVIPERVAGVEGCLTPGYLDPPALASALSMADVFLAPFADGASTHRTSLMAALQHGVATVTTLSEFTDEVLRSGSALAFATVGDVERFTAQAVLVATDARVRHNHGTAGRALYEREFAWSAVCAGLHQTVEAAVTACSR